MAIPALVAQSPGVGQISWPAFNIRYTPDADITPAVTFPVAANFTSKRFVWWRYNGGSPIIESGDFLPDGLTGSINANGSFDVADTVDPTMAKGYVRTDSGAGTVKLTALYGVRSMELFPDTNPRVIFGTEDFIDVATGDVIYFSTEVRGSAAISGGIYMRFQKPDGTYVGPATNRSATTSWNRYTTQVTIPAGVTKIRPVALAVAADGVGTEKVYLKNYVTSRGAALPAGLSPDDLFLFVNKNGVPLNAQTASLVDGGLVVNGSILADAIGANQITSVHILAGTIDATKIKAYTISADKLQIGSFDNLMSDPTFLTPLGGGAWPIQTGWAKVTGGARAGTDSLRVNATGAPNLAINDSDYFYPVDTVDTGVQNNVSYFLSTIAKSSVVNPGGGIVIGARWRITGGTTVDTYVGTGFAGAAGVWTRYSGRVSAPANAVGVQFFIGVTASQASGTVEFDYAGANRAGTGELIVDGTISGTKIIANSIKAEQISSDLVTAEGLFATQAFVGTLEAVDLAAVTLTGLTISTRPVAERGIKLGMVDNTEALVAYREDGSVFLKAVPSEGMAVVAGEVKARTITTSSDDPLVAPGASLGGVTEIQQGGRVLLTGSTTAPKSPPTVVAGYDQFYFDQDHDWGYRRGAAFDGTYWYTLQTIAGGSVRLERWTPAGDFVDYLVVAFGGSNSLGCGVAVVNNTIVCLTRYTGASSHVYSLIGVSPISFTGQWIKDVSAELQTSGLGSDATIGPDSTNSNGLVLAQGRSNGTMLIRLLSITNFSTGAYTVDSTVSNADGWMPNLACAMRVSADFAGPRFVLGATNASDFRVINTLGSFVPGEYFPLGSSYAKVGLTYTDGAFRSLDANGTNRSYSNIWSTNANDQIKWIGNTLAGRSRPVTVGTSNGSTSITSAAGFMAADVGSTIVRAGIPAGTTIASVTNSSLAVLSTAATANATLEATINTLLETTLSPRAKIVLPNRARLTVTTSLIPTGTLADRVLIYVSKGATDPGASSAYRQFSEVIGQTTWRYASLLTGSNTPPSTSNFPAGLSSDLVASDGGFNVNSASNGSIGTGTFAASIRAYVNSWRRKGTGTVPITAVNTLATLPVTFSTAFPAGTTPEIFLTIRDLSAQAQARVSVTSVSETGFTIQGIRANGAGSFDVRWVADAF